MTLIAKNSFPNKLSTKKIDSEILTLIRKQRQLVMEQRKIDIEYQAWLEYLKTCEEIAKVFE